MLRTQIFVLKLSLLYGKTFLMVSHWTKGTQLYSTSLKNFQKYLDLLFTEMGSHPCMWKNHKAGVHSRSWNIQLLSVQYWYS